MSLIWRLQKSFGAPFLILITCVYWTQGFRSLPWMAISYLMKDELNLSPSASQFMMSLAFMPWSVKPVYGVLSDCVPIAGSRRVSYLLISSILSFIPWLLLGFFESIRLASFGLTSILIVQNLGAAMADVVIDAMIAEAARKERCEYAGDLQSMSWYAMALGGMFGSITGGLALSMVGVPGIFLLFSIFPLLQLVSCGFVNEKDLTSGAMESESGEDSIVESTKVDTRGVDVNHVNEDKRQPQGNGNELDSGTFDKDLIDQDEGWVEIDARKSHDSDSKHNVERKHTKGEGSLHGIGSGEQSHQFGLRKRKNDVDVHEGIEQTTVQEAKHGVSFPQKIKGVSVKLFQTVRQPAIRQPMLWFFLAQISVPSLSTIMFYYQTNHLHLDASFLGTSRVVGWGALMVGTYVYNHYLKHVQLRRIFWWTHISLALITLLDVFLVTGLNLRLGIPNKLFVIGASVLGDAVTQFKFMPFLVLSGRLCQPGIEGTLFALFMSLNNFATTLSSFFGAGLASSLHISSDKFDNFGIGICIQSLCTLIPIFFLRLIPSEATGVSP